MPAAPNIQSEAFLFGQFPREVGLYESPACERMNFVGATEAMMSENHMTTTFLSKSMDMQLRNFLDAEASIVISEPQCQYCYAGRFKLSLEYPVNADVDLAYIYSASKSNQNMAKLSSESLRRKLQRQQTSNCSQ